MRITSDQRDWLFFTGWLLTGSGYLLALLTVLSIGVFILPIPLIATVALATRRGALRCLPGLVSSASLPLFLLTYLNRDGPGTHCTASMRRRELHRGSARPMDPAGRRPARPRRRLSHCSSGFGVGLTVTRVPSHSP